MTEEQLKLKQENMSDERLLDVVESKLSKLCKTGGRSLTMSIPPHEEDFDMAIYELINRYKKAKEKSDNVGWTSVEDKLPEDGSYVLALHNRGTWIDSDDQNRVNCVVVKFVKLEPVEKVTLYNPSFGRFDTTIKNEDPYKWKPFGPDSFKWNQITHWTEIPEPPR